MFLRIEDHFTQSIETGGGRSPLCSKVGRRYTIDMSVKIADIGPSAVAGRVKSRNCRIKNKAGRRCDRFFVINDKVFL